MNAWPAQGQSKSKSSNETTHQTTHCNTTVPVLFLAHHKTGTFVAIGIFTRLCQTLPASCCVLFKHPWADVLGTIARQRPRFALTVFSGSLASAWGGREKQIPTGGLRLVHFIREPLSIVRSSFHYHRSGHENHSVLLTWEQPPSDIPGAVGKSRQVVSGILDTPPSRGHYCKVDAGELSRSERDYLSAAVDKLSRQGNDTLHQHVLARASLPDALLFEAAWNFCEIRAMAAIASSTCVLPWALQLDIEKFEEDTAAQGQAIADFLGQQPHGKNGGILSRKERSILVNLWFPRFDRHKSTNSTQEADDLLRELRNSTDINGFLSGSMRLLKRGCPDLGY